MSTNLSKPILCHRLGVWVGLSSLPGHPKLFCPIDVTGGVGHPKMFNGWLTLAAACFFFIRSLLLPLASCVSFKWPKNKAIQKFFSDNKQQNSAVLTLLVKYSWEDIIAC